MGLNFRRRSGRIADGSKLIVPGQITTGVKVFPNSFEYKKGSKNENLGPSIEILITQTPLPPPSSTPIPTPTPTPTPTPEVLINPIITENHEYIDIGDNFYLMFVDPIELVNPIIVDPNVYLNVGENEYLEYNDPL